MTRNRHTSEDCSPGMEGFIVFSRYPSIVVTRLYGATPKEMEPSHGEKNPCVIGH